MARYDSTLNRMVRTDDQADLQTIRRRFTVAEINAGAELLPAVGGFAYRLIDATLIAIGGAASGATAVVLLGTRSAGAVTLLSVAIAALTQSAVVRAGAANATVLADGASFTPLDANAPLTVGKTGGALATATHVDVFVTYALEG